VATPSIASGTTYAFVSSSVAPASRLRNRSVPVRGCHGFGFVTNLGSAGNSAVARATMRWCCHLQCCQENRPPLASSRRPVKRRLTKDRVLSKTKGGLRLPFFICSQLSPARQQAAGTYLSRTAKGSSAWGAVAEECGRSGHGLRWRFSPVNFVDRSRRLY